MSSLPETTPLQDFCGKLQVFTNAIDNVHIVWLKEIQQEAYGVLSSDFNTDPELMHKTPLQKANCRKQVLIELNESCSKRRFSRGKCSSSVQMTLNTISELVSPHGPDNSSEEPARRTRHNKAAAASKSKPVKRSTRNKAKEPEEDEEEMENIPDERETDEVQHLGSTVDQKLVSQAVVKIPLSERLSAELLLNSGRSPSRSANKIPIAASECQATPQGSSRATVRRALVLQCSDVGLGHSMTQEAFLKKKARLGNSTCSSSITVDMSINIEPEDAEETTQKQLVNEEQNVMEEATKTNTEPEITPPDAPMKTKDDEPSEPINELLSTSANRRFTRSMRARTSDTDSRGESKPKEDGRSTRSGSKRRAAEEVVQKINTPKNKFTTPKKCVTVRASADRCCNSDHVRILVDT